jgi:hypothetical protein
MITLRSFLKIVSPIKMISSEQVKNITYIYDQFISSELKGWNELDNLLWALEWLDDSELYREAEVLYSYQKNKKMGCPYIHAEGTVCFVVRILEAVEAITDLYKETKNLHPKNKYILAYYLALCQDGQICEIPESNAI